MIDGIAYLVMMLYGLGFVTVIAILLNRHRQSQSATRRSKRVVFGLFALAVIFHLFIAPTAAILLMAGIGIYVILHQKVAAWTREMDERDRAESTTKQSDGKSVIGPKT